MQAREDVTGSLTTELNTVGTIRKRTAEYIYTGNPCRNGHTGPRYKSGNCVQCLLDREAEKQRDPLHAEQKRQREMRRYRADPIAANERSKKWREENAERVSNARKAKYDANKEEVKALARAYRKANPERVKASNRAYYEKNREEINERMRLYRLANLERIRELNKACSRRYYSENKDYYLLKKQKRRAQCNRAMPRWANLAAIAAIYAEARRLREEEGVHASVDHTIPLKGKNAFGEIIVCGLHCEANLQILPLLENKSKGNRWWPDMPEKEF